MDLWEYGWKNFLSQKSIYESKMGVNTEPTIRGKKKRRDTDAKISGAYLGISEYKMGNWDWALTGTLQSPSTDNSWKGTSGVLNSKMYSNLFGSSTASWFNRSKDQLLPVNCGINNYTFCRLIPHTYVFISYQCLAITARQWVPSPNTEFTEEAIAKVRYAWYPEEG